MTKRRHRPNPSFAHPFVDSWVLPCKRCGSTNFDLKDQARPSGARTIQRYCVECQKRHVSAYVERNRDAKRVRDREYQRKARKR